MKTMTLDLNRELAELDEQTALQFIQAVQVMLKMVKSRQTNARTVPFHDRIVWHPAIGTWPAQVSVDEHIANLREEW